VVKMRYAFLETERLAREIAVDRGGPTMVMCPVCNRSVPEGCECPVCAGTFYADLGDPAYNPDDDPDKPDLW
jgi:hypothetical protein